MRFSITLAAAIIGLSGCAPIQHTADVAQPVNAQLTAGPGDVLVRVDKKRNLTNAFGGSDIFGRTTNEGFSELCFGGVEADGTVILYRRGTTILTNETTMSRTPIAQSFSSVNGTATSSNGITNFNATGNTTTILPASAYHVAVPSGALAIRLPSGTKNLLFEGYTVEILNASAGALNYRISGNAR